MPGSARIGYADGWALGQAKGETMTRNPIRGAATLALLLAAVPAAAARADCLMVPEPDACTMMWTLENDFWVGEYAVEAGPALVTVDGRSMGGPPEPLASATVFQIGADLVIEHPERLLQADLVSLGPGDPAWSWNDVPDWGGRSDLADLELTLDCSNAELPRWSAPTYSEDGVPMTLDLVAVSPFTIMGRLHADTVMDGHSVSYLRQVNFTRGRWPIEGLEPEVVSSDACDQFCGEGNWRCPGRPE